MVYWSYSDHILVNILVIFWAYFQHFGQYFGHNLVIGALCYFLGYFLTTYIMSIFLPLHSTIDNSVLLYFSANFDSDIFQNLCSEYDIKLKGLLMHVLCIKALNLELCLHNLSLCNLVFSSPSLKRTLNI